MSAVIGTLYAGGETVWTDEVRTTLELDADTTTELLDLVTSSTDLHLCTVALAFVPAVNTSHSQANSASYPQRHGKRMSSSSPVVVNRVKA